MDMDRQCGLQTRQKMTKKGRGPFLILLRSFLWILSDWFVSFISEFGVNASFRLAMAPKPQSLRQRWPTNSIWNKCDNLCDSLCQIYSQGFLMWTNDSMRTLIYTPLSPINMWGVDERAA
jgi:hypothetical protein